MGTPGVGSTPTPAVFALPRRVVDTRGLVSQPVLVPSGPRRRRAALPGINGQMVHVSRRTRTVCVKLSSWPDRSSPDSSRHPVGVRRCRSRPHRRRSVVQPQATGSHRRSRAATGRRVAPGSEGAPTARPIDGRSLVRPKLDHAGRAHARHEGRAAGGRYGRTEDAGIASAGQLRRRLSGVAARSAARAERHFRDPHVFPHQRAADLFLRADGVQSAGD